MDEPQGQQPQPIVVDIPGVGTREFPVGMSPQQIQQKIAEIRMGQGPRTTQSTVGRDPRAAFLGNAGQRAVDMAMDPELVAGVASLVPGVGTLASGAIGAGTSVARDVVQGRTDPVSMGLRAVGHGAVNMIPGAVGGMVAKRAMPAAADVGVDMATHGPVRGGILATLKAMMGGGEAAAGAVKAAAPVDELAGMELAGGIKVLSTQGLKKLVQTSIDLENAGAPKAQLAALDKLIAQVRTKLAGISAQPAEILSRAGMPTTSAAERAAAANAAKEAEAAGRGATISKRLRALLGLGSETYEAERPR